MLCVKRLHRTPIVSTPADEGIKAKIVQQLDTTKDLEFEWEPLNESKLLLLIEVLQGMAHTKVLHLLFTLSLKAELMRQLQRSMEQLQTSSVKLFAALFGIDVQIL